MGHRATKPVDPYDDSVLDEETRLLDRLPGAVDQHTRTNRDWCVLLCCHQPGKGQQHNQGQHRSLGCSESILHDWCRCSALGSALDRLHSLLLQELRQSVTSRVQVCTLIL